MPPGGDVDDWSRIASLLLERHTFGGPELGRDVNDGGGFVEEASSEDVMKADQQPSELPAVESSTPKAV